MSRSVKGNIFSQNGEWEKTKSPVFVLKPRPLCSPPPLTPVSSYKASSSPSLTPFTRLNTPNGNPTKPLYGPSKQAVSGSNNCFRVIQPCQHVELQQKDGGNGKVEGNKLPPMSVLAGTSAKGGAMTRYTDR